MADNQTKAPDATDYSDKALVQLMMRVQGKAKGQAECAVHFLTMLGYSSVERFQILSSNNAKINVICYFGSLWPIILIALILVFIVAGGVYNFFWAEDDFVAVVSKKTSTWFSK